ncbi:transglycosylase domain-containing protein [Subtercola sp. RTI3]|uniref:transglycosylase domain-containing protein n=1 Tax=Subtercola sp. RTI3 TaxID=3048639 RepID=UPI002B231282|nr:transglycosylase domain-containing protein [Subtercola sp. RTI3]MEA9985921.1 transglycosylase domain-containing protein [Subtercola sp. RTI3]
MVTPALAVTGLAANNTIGVFENLPSYIKPDALSQTSSIYAKNADGSDVLLASFFDQNRQTVGWTDISQNFKDAIVSTEDPRFYVHGGMDVQSTVRALVANTVSGGITSGASTISQQYVKNILVQRAEAISDPVAQKAAYDDATATTTDRKLKEMKLAIGLEKEYSKDDILLGYMNIALFGGQIYGIQAASRYFFNVNADSLSIAQAASLAAMVNEPEGLRIDDPTKIQANKDRRDKDVLASMLKEHAISQTEFDAAVATPVEPHITPPSTGCQTASNGAGFFCDYVKRIIEQDPTFGATQDERDHNLNTGGYKIYTTLDTNLQAAANTAVSDYVPQSMSSVDIGGAFVTVEPGTGKILAMAQNKTYSQDPSADPATNTAVNYSTDSAFGGSTGFQNGSTSKIFVILDWLKTGHSLGDIVNGANNQKFTTSNIHNSCGAGAPVEGYVAGNDAGEAGGRASVLTQFDDSVNNAFLNMATQLDLCDINAIATSFGMHRANGTPMDTGLYATVLGGNEVAPLTMAAAYAGVANKGAFCTPVAISSITDATGTAVAVPQTTCTQAIDPKIAAAAMYAMQSVVQNGTATTGNPNDGTPHFGKTGTTDAEKDVWIVGGTSKLVSASWVGNVNGNVSIRHTTVTGNNGQAVGSGYSRLYVWKQFYKGTADAYGGDSFPQPDSSLTKTATATVPDVSGGTIDQAQSKLTSAGFGFSDGGQVDSDKPAGQVANTNPSAGSSVAKGSSVTAYTSNGKLTPLGDTTGQSTAAAAAALAGWNVTTTVSPDPKCTSDTIVSQNPGAGSYNKSTTPVAVVVCPKK